MTAIITCIYEGQHPFLIAGKKDPVTIEELPYLTPFIKGDCTEDHENDLQDLEMKMPHLIKCLDLANLSCLTSGKFSSLKFQEIQHCVWVCVWVSIYIHT